MKVLLVMTLLFGSINTYAQDSTKVKSDTTSLTMNKVYEDVKVGLTGLSKALKVGTEHVYGILVKQQVVNSVINLTSYLLYLIMIVVVLKTGLKWKVKHDILGKEDEEKHKNSYWSGWDNNSSHYGTLSTVTFFLTGLLIIIFFSSLCVSLSSTITGLINPEYGAIKDIVSFIK